MKEIEKRKESEQKLAYQATHDALTGLPNRKYGYEQLEDLLYRAKVRNTQFLVMFIDLDNFKHINDSLGHLAGDYILKQSSLRLQSAIREKDILVRLGG
ncbi:sensory box/GGDEF family protein ScrC [Photobacterium aphoticum]|uniref:Sensory box/GGDEF family protein ScrC n=1 Tax=Photobacterium aphoticum TaxID=754436 RepID=A0A090R7W3_9GAMM|nr:sensory box/GGDEF family protein ScrC [Photobacterium aphoticum]